MKYIFLISFLLLAVCSFSQTIVDPSTFPSKTTPDGTEAIYTREDGVNRKVLLSNAKKYLTPDVQTTLIAYEPSATGNTLNLMEFVKHNSSGKIWYIDSAGDAFLLRDSTVAIADGDYGDITFSSSGTVATIDAGAVGADELASTGVVAGTYGSSTLIPIVTLDGDGRVTNISTVSVSGGGGSLSDGDKGDIDVTGSGTVWTIDTSSVVWDYLAQSVKDSISAGGSGVTDGDKGDITVDSGVWEIDNQTLLNLLLQDTIDILATGQSNMVNRDNSYSSTYSTDTLVFVFNYTTSIFEVANPNSNNISPEDDATTNRNNIAWSFARKLRKLMRNQSGVVRIMVSAKGGMESHHWTPEIESGYTGNEMLDSIVNKINRSPSDFSPDIILWHQGETDDISDLDVDNYFSRIASIYDTLTSLSQIQNNAIFIMGQLAIDGSSDLSRLNAKIDSVTLRQKDFGNRKITAANYDESTIDGIHFGNDEIERIGLYYLSALLSSGLISEANIKAQGATLFELPKGENGNTLTYGEFGWMPTVITSGNLSGSGSDTRVAFFSGDTITTNSNFIYNGTNLSIGGSTSASRYKFGFTDVSGLVSASGQMYQGTGLYFDGSWKHAGTNPGGIFHINSTTGDIRMHQTSAGADDAVASLTEVFTLKNGTGNLGIGTTSPSQKLDVNGVINANTGFRVGGLTATSGNYLRGNGTNFVSAAIQSSDINSLAWMLGGQNTGATAAIGPTDAQTFNLSTGGSTRLSLSGAGKLTSGILTDIQLTASDSVTLNASGSGFAMNSGFTRLYDGSNIVMQVNNSTGDFSWSVADNSANAFVASVTGGGDSFLQHDSTNGSEVTTIGSFASGSTIQAAAPFIAKSYTATQASALTAVNGMIIYVTDTNGTFTSVGIWAYENSAWVKL